VSQYLTSCGHDADGENGGIAGRETSIVLPGTRYPRRSRGWFCPGRRSLGQRLMLGSSCWS
jgi:hypothetical protein